MIIYEFPSKSLQQHQSLSQVLLCVPNSIETQLRDRILNLHCCTLLSMHSFGIQLLLVIEVGGISRNWFLLLLLLLLRLLVLLVLLWLLEITSALFESLVNLNGFGLSIEPSFVLVF